MTLPNELWLMIIDTLGKNGELRAMVNLTKALGSTWKGVGNKYFSIELIKERNKIGEGKYDKKMFEFWKRTGIDDGMNQSDTHKAIKEKKLMYRTIWSCNVNQINDASYISNLEYLHNEKIYFTYKIIKDRRFLSDKVYFTNCWVWGSFELEEKNLKKFKKEKELFLEKVRQKNNF